MLSYTSVTINAGQSNSCAKFFMSVFPVTTNIRSYSEKLLNIFLVLIISLIPGPLNEEFGWRGFALDRLFIKFGFTGATLILGFIWGIWHLAWYFTPGQAQYNLLQNSLFDAVMYISSVMLLNFAVSFI